MKAHMDPNGKGKWSKDWGDKVKKTFKRIFSKSARQKIKIEIKKILDDDNKR